MACRRAALLLGSLLLERAASLEVQEATAAAHEAAPLETGSGLDDPTRKVASPPAARIFLSLSEAHRRNIHGKHHKKKHHRRHHKRGHGKHHSNMTMHANVTGQEVPAKEKAEVDAHTASIAAESAKAAAQVANTVATKSVKVLEKSQSALKDAKDALHGARVNAMGLSKEQAESLKNAEAKLKDATKAGDYGKLESARYTKGSGDKYTEAKVDELQKVLDSRTETEKKEPGHDNSKYQKCEIEVMKEELQKLRVELAEMRQQTTHESEIAQIEEMERQISELETLLTQLQKQEAEQGSEGSNVSHDEMKAEIEKLREAVRRFKVAHNEANKKRQADMTYEIESQGAPPVGGQPGYQPPPAGGAGYGQDVPAAGATSGAYGPEGVAPPAEPCDHNGLDIDTSMPYGDLEPFGREDTAQELTEASIRESDEMVDQLERAEVAEEKRAVFRALTRLRGAAITSFDGVARSQTGNIDQYAKVHKWRMTHPLHHLAMEESDITKWAFPDNADF
jgi:hypothetical protein